MIMKDLVQQARNNLKNVKNDQNEINQFGSYVIKNLKKQSEDHLVNYDESHLTETKSIVDGVFEEISELQVEAPKEKGVVGFFKGIFGQGGEIAQMTSRKTTMGKITLMEQKLNSQKANLLSNLEYINNNKDETEKLLKHNEADIIAVEERLEEEQRKLEDLVENHKGDDTFESNRVIQNQYDVVQCWERRVNDLKDTKSDLHQSLRQHDGLVKSHNASLEVITKTIDTTLGRVTRMIATNSVLETMETANNMADVLTQGGEKLTMLLSDQSLEISKKLNDSLYKVENLDVKRHVHGNYIQMIKNDHESRKEYAERNKLHRIESEKLDQEVAQQYEETTSSIVDDIIDVTKTKDGIYE